MPAANTLSALFARFAADGCALTIAPEIEFYVEGGDLTDAMRDECYTAFGAAGILTFEIIPEVTEHHHEIALVPVNDPVIAVKNLEKVKTILTKVGKKHKRKIRFDAKPYPEKSGSGLHIHVGLLNQYGDYLFAKKGDTVETELMLHAIGGLCATMPEAMIYFAPTEKSYGRFTSKRNETLEGIARYNNAPVNISWGGNNRTTAIRIPSSTLDPNLRHIEHRVAGADADPEQVMAAVLGGIHYGVKNKIAPPERVYGNAFDEQYDLPKLPYSLEEAKVLHKEGKILKNYFT